MHILSVGIHLSIFFNTTCMYVMYILNEFVIVNELFMSFFSFIHSMLVHPEYTNVNIGPACLVCLTWIVFVMGDCWRSRDKLIRDVLSWTPSHGQAKPGWPARTYVQQLCKDTGCSPEDQPDAMYDRERWRERVKDIHADDTTRWWWWWILVLGLNWIPSLPSSNLIYL